MSSYGSLGIRLCYGAKCSLTHVAAEAATPEELLGKIGRNADKKLTPFAESWDKLNEVWLKTKKMNDLGLATKEKR